jgi:hypothetical protein
MADESIVWGITAEDISKNRLVDAPSWLPTEIVDFAVEDSKAGDSKNLHITMKVFHGELKGLENPFIYFSEKMPVMAAPLLKACKFQQNPDGSFNAKLSKGTMIGKKFLAHWVRGTYNNKPVNQIDDYAPLPSTDGEGS